MAEKEFIGDPVVLGFEKQAELDGATIKARTAKGGD